MSPLLFVIVMEVLSRMISATVNGGFLSGFYVGSRNVGALNISPLLLADDILLFCGATPNQCHYLQLLVLMLRSCLKFEN